MLDLKQQQLAITLTEPVLFLRSSDPSGRLQPDPNDPPTLVRGILTLNVAKPIGISSIDVELTGTLTVSYPEGVPPRNVYITEKHTVYSSTVSVFRAGQLPQGKRPASVGPGLSAANFRAGAPAPAPFSVRRGYSEDQHGVGDPLGLDPTPPYTSVARSHTQREQRAFTRRDSPTRVSDQLRRPPSHALERQGFRGAVRERLRLPFGLGDPRPFAARSSPRPHSFPFQHPDAIAALFGNEAIRQGNDNISDPPGLSSTPPYTPVASPIEPGAATRGDREHGRPLNDRLERQGHRTGVSRRPQSFSSLALPESPSIVSNGPLLQEDTHAAHSGEGSVRNAIRELPHIHPHRDPSPGGPSRSLSPENRSGPGTRGSSRESSVAPAGRSRWRLSLNTVLDTVLDVTSWAPPKSRGLGESERGRSRVRGSAEGQSREPVQGGNAAGTESNNHLGAKARRPSCPTDHREHHFLGLGRVLGLERDHEKKESDARPKSQEQGEGWREFKPGTYSYPISFLLPPNLPPTFSVPRGSLRYTIKAVAHRPGAFTPKLSCHVPLLIVAAPAVGAGEGLAPGDPGPLFFQRQWEGKLAYSFGLSSRLFRIGSEQHLEASASGGVLTSVNAIDAAYGTAVLDLTLLPIEKIKIWRLSVFVNEHLKYLDGRRKLCRDEDDRRVLLLDVQDVACQKEVTSGLVAGESEEEKATHKNKHRNKHDSTPIPVPIPIPLLPTPLSPDRSPLLRHLSPTVDSSTLVGPGPYTLSIPIGLPECNGRAGGGRLHFSVKQKSSLVRVEHALRVVMRVERVGDLGDSNGKHQDEEGDKKRCFDITIQTPIAILSCRCVPEYQTLPRYSPTTEDDLANHAACPCQPVTERQGQGQEQGEAMSGPSSTRESDDGHASHGPADDHLSAAHHHAHAGGRPSPLAIPPSSPASSPHPSPPPGTHRTEGHSHGEHRHSRSSLHHAGVAANVVATAERTATPHSSRPPSPPPSPPLPPSALVLLSASEPVLAQYERLVSGLESEAGEAPPSYESIAPSHHSRV